MSYGTFRPTRSVGEPLELRAEGPLFPVPNPCVGKKKRKRGD